MGTRLTTKAPRVAINVVRKKLREINSNNANRKPLNKSMHPATNRLFDINHMATKSSRILEVRKTHDMVSLSACKFAHKLRVCQRKMGA
jgi:hypothetical protein